MQQLKGESISFAQSYTQVSTTGKGFKERRESLYRHTMLMRHSILELRTAVLIRPSTLVQLYRHMLHTDARRDVFSITVTKLHEIKFRIQNEHFTTAAHAKHTTTNTH